MKMELFGQTKEILLNDVLKILIRKYNLLDNSNNCKKKKNFYSIINSIPQTVRHLYGLDRIKTLKDVMKCEILYLEKCGGIGVDFKIDPDLVVEEEIVDFVKEHNIKLYRAPATNTATEKIGLRIVANIVMIGAIVKVTNIVSVEAAKQAILDSVPKGTEDKNIQAFEAGYALL